MLLYIYIYIYIYIFHAFEEFVLSADCAALCRNSQKARQSPDWCAFWESPNGAALSEDPQQIAQRFLGIAKWRCAFWKSPEGAALSRDPLQLATQQTFPGVQS